MKRILVSLCSFALVSAGLVPTVSAHPEGETAATAEYIANAGVIVSAGGTKILFDPLFRVGFNNYLVPSEETFAAMMAGTAPFDNVDVVFISHSHGDHFSSEDANAFLAAHPNAKLVAPVQAVDAMKYVDSWDEAYTSRVTSIALEVGDPGEKFDLPGVSVFAVRIPHAGWPGRANVQNLVYRVAMEEGATVMHLGDADVNDDHYAPYKDEWLAKKTDTAFPPYWFFLTPGGNEILKDRLNAEHAIGVHVPVKVPEALLETGKDYFDEAGETRALHRAEPTSDTTDLSERPLLVAAEAIIAAPAPVKRGGTFLKVPARHGVVGKLNKEVSSFLLFPKKTWSAGTPVYGVATRDTDVADQTLGQISWCAFERGTKALNKGEIVTACFVANGNKRPHLMAPAIGDLLYFKPVAGDIKGSVEPPIVSLSEQPLGLEMTVEYKLEYLGRRNGRVTRWLSFEGKQRQRLDAFEFNATDNEGSIVLPGIDGTVTFKAIEREGAKLTVTMPSGETTETISISAETPLFH